MPPRTALVLSAGGMFGAYQAGAWRVLAARLRPDLVVGASIGAVNGWAIAGGCPPEELIERWRTPLGKLDDYLRSFHACYQPRVEIGVVATDLFRMRPRLFRGSEITWEHLAASCAVLGIYRQRRIGGRIYSDGGLLGALPLWAAIEMGATRIVSIHALPFGVPSRAVRLFMRGLRGVVRWRPPAPDGIEAITIAPDGHLGRARDMLLWNRERAEQWIERGIEDAERHFPSAMF